MKKILLTLLLTLSISVVNANDFIEDVKDIIGTSPEVNINLGAGLVNTILAFAGEDEDARKASEVLSGLNKLRVTVFDISGNKNTQDLTSLIKLKVEDLTAAGYEQIVTVKEDDEMVHIVAKVNGDSLKDVMIIVMEEGDELVVVSMEGEVNVKQLALISDEFDMDLSDILDS